jgi:hypothetical protein
VRQCLLAAALAALAAGVVAVPPASAGSVDKCAEKGTSTVRSTSAVRVFWKGDHLYGCLRESGVRRHLFGGEPMAGNQYDTARLIRVAGRRVAFVFSSFCTVCGEGEPVSSIHEVALRSGVRRNLDKLRSRNKGGFGVVVDALVLDRCGRIAYRSVLSSPYRKVDQDPELQAWVGDQRRLLDRGAIDRGSIDIDRASVRWTRDGKAKSAPLLPACG